MEKENVGEGKERVLREKICNHVLEEQNMEKENVGRGRGRGRVLRDKFCNHVSESSPKQSNLNHNNCQNLCI